jgi:hypothetical protein
MARTGMTDVISDLRGMVDAGTADYTINSVSYWTDDQLQVTLDRHRSDFYHSPAYPTPSIGVGGTVIYNDYWLGIQNVETTTGGTAVFYVQDASGSAIGTASYSIDYRQGKVSFVSDTGGSTYYATGRAYDLNAAAADVWRQKAAQVAKMFSFSTDNHRADKGALRKEYLGMADYYMSLSGNSIMSVDLVRDDTTRRKDNYDLD